MQWRSRWTWTNTKLVRPRKCVFRHCIRVGEHRERSHIYVHTVTRTHEVVTGKMVLWLQNKIEHVVCTYMVGARSVVVYPIKKYLKQYEYFNSLSQYIVVFANETNRQPGISQILSNFFLSKSPWNPNAVIHVCQFVLGNPCVYWRRRRARTPKTHAPNIYK